MNQLRYTFYKIQGTTNYISVQSQCRFHQNFILMRVLCRPPEEDIRRIVHETRLFSVFLSAKLKVIYMDFVLISVGASTLNKLRICSRKKEAELGQDLKISST